MSKVVLDASAVLALLNAEPGGERVEETIPGAAMSAVNLSERPAHFPIGSAGIIHGKTYACRTTSTPTRQARAMLCQKT